jgi:hypothetical protein
MKSIYKKEEKENIIITVTPELMSCSIHLKEPQVKLIVIAMMNRQLLHEGAAAK